MSTRKGSTPGAVVQCAHGVSILETSVLNLVIGVTSWLRGALALLGAGTVVVLLLSRPSLQTSWKLLGGNAQDSHHTSEKESSAQPSQNRKTLPLDPTPTYVLVPLGETT